MTLTKAEVALIGAAGLLAIAAHDARADNWTRGDVEREALYLVLHTIDWRQTQDIPRHDGMYEVNPILGQHPSNARVNTYFTAAAVGHVLIANALTARTRMQFQAATIALEVTVTAHNKHIGLSVGF